MKEIKVNLSIEESNTKKAETQDDPSPSEVPCTKKPRALIIKATNKILTKSQNF